MVKEKPKGNTFYVGYSLDGIAINESRFVSIEEAIAFAGPYLQNMTYRPRAGAPQSWLYVCGEMESISKATRFHRDNVERYKSHYGSLALDEENDERLAVAMIGPWGVVESYLRLLQVGKFVEVLETLGGWHGYETFHEYSARTFIRPPIDEPKD